MANKNNTFVLSITNSNNISTTVNITGNNHIYEFIEDNPMANLCTLYNFTLSPQSVYIGCDQSSSVVAGMYK